MVTGALVTCAAASACSKEATAPPPAVCSAPQGSSAEARTLAGDDATFAVDLFQPAVASAGTGQNFILSPHGVFSTLAMIDVGAANETDAQIQSALHLPGNAASIAPAYAALACEDETDGTSNGDQLSIASSVWAQKGMAFEPSFLTTLAKGYDAPLQQVDYETNATAAVTAIDGWVSTQTQGEIPSLLQPTDLTSTTRLVLVNAIYFKGAWETAFDPSQTSPRPFTLSDGTAVTTPTMDGFVTLRSGSTSGLSVYELGYKGGAMAMDFLVPSGSVADLEASLTSASLGAAVASLGQARANVEVQLPKFAFHTHLALAPILSGLGVADLFDPAKADLEGMDGAKDLYVSTFVQEAIIQVDETGTVAAAATAGGAVAASYTLPTTIDRPFLFLIRDTSNGSLLFMGHVEDPRQD
jgi:serpin B